MKQNIVVVGPRGCGKTRNAGKLRDHFGLLYVYDAGDTRLPPPESDTLILCNEVPEWAQEFRTIPYDDAMQLATKAAADDSWNSLTLMSARDEPAA